MLMTTVAAYQKMEGLSDNGEKKSNFAIKEWQQERLIGDAGTRMTKI